MAVHILNSSTWEAGAGCSLTLWSTWSTESVPGWPGLHNGRCLPKPNKQIHYLNTQQPNRILFICNSCSSMSPGCQNKTDLELNVIQGWQDGLPLNLTFRIQSVGLIVSCREPDSHKLSSDLHVPAREHMWHPELVVSTAYWQWNWADYQMAVHLQFDRIQSMTYFRAVDYIWKNVC